MPSVREQIESSASENTRIQADLAETDYAPAALKQQTTYVADLDKQINDTETLIKELTLKTHSERKGHEKYRDSKFRRFSYKLQGKEEVFNAKADKEEREYLDALQEEVAAKGRLNVLNKDLDQAKIKQTELAATAERHEQSQNELDTLYNSIFAGPTPDFPEEDAKEEIFRRADLDHNNLQERLQADQEAGLILQEACDIIEFTVSFLREALQYSKMDLHGMGGRFAEFAEKSALSRATISASQVQLLVEQACRVQPRVQPISAMSISRGRIFSGSVFDNFQLIYHEKIISSVKEVVQVRAELAFELNRAKEREEELRIEILPAAERLEAARKELQLVRQQTFERVLRGEPHSTEVPEYSDGEDEAAAAPPGYLTDAVDPRPPQYEQ